jgi:g-D-glutamyl-meso-diaminopimelate peptidase
MEWLTSVLLLDFLDELCDAYRSRRETVGLVPEFILKSRTLLFVPMLNPDGVDLSIQGRVAGGVLAEREIRMNGGSEDFSHWQANARGVDLNHNYNAGFAEYKRLEGEMGILGGAPTRYSGECPESEPEVGYLCNFLRFSGDFDLALSLHTQGEEIFFSDNGKNRIRTAAIARHLAASTGYRLSRAEGLAAYGGLSDWCASALGISSFTLECGLGKNPLPISPVPRSQAFRNPPFIKIDPHSSSRSRQDSNRAGFRCYYSIHRVTNVLQKTPKKRKIKIFFAF